MKSIWEKGISFQHSTPLNGDIRADVLVIGAGMAGLLCAYRLKEAGIDCIIAEASKICGGITKNTTAKITSQHGLIYDKLISQFGAEKAEMYLHANEKALGEYRRIAENINCDFETKDSYVYSANDLRKLENELIALDKIGFKAEYVMQTPLPFPIKGAVKFSNQAQFHPLKFASAIASDLKIYENTSVREINGYVAVTDYGKITADKIIVATHFPFINKHGSYFMKLYQSRSYVTVFENAPEINGMYVDEAQTGMSFRNYKDMLFIGGSDHRTGKKGDGWQKLREFASENYPNTTEKYAWATQDCMTLDGVPYIGRYSAQTDNLYVATGFNKWGMSSSMVAAMILCDMICGNNNPYSEVFSPSRSVLHPQLAVNLLESATNLLTPSSVRCPHMGCALKHNIIEDTWDCPCHGSRFTSEGKLIDNPSLKNLAKPPPR